MDDLELTPEQLEEFNKSVEKALSFVTAIFYREIRNKLLLEQPAHIQECLELLDRYIQITYYGSIRNGEVEDAVKGLMSGVRAAFLYGYEQALVQQSMDTLENSFTPLLGPIGKGFIQ